MARTHRLPVVLSRSRAEIERLAEAFLRRFAREHIATPGALPVLEAFDCFLPEHYGFAADVDGALPAGVEAATDFELRKIAVSPSVYEASECGDGRARFTLMHEIGHVATIGVEMAAKLRLLRSTGLGVQWTARRAELRPFEDPEWQADAFAAAALMPRRAFARAAARETAAGRVERLAEQFGVTPAAARVRLGVLRRKRWL